MPYITVGDVVAAAPGIEITAQSRPNLAQVNTFITDREREVNASLAAQFQTPITGPLSLAKVRRIVTHLVLADVLRAKAYGKTNPRDIGADTAEKEGRTLIDRILDPGDDYTLEDAIVIAGKGTSLEGADALEGSGPADYFTPITRYTRF
jgi:hypothetical protein